MLDWNGFRLYPAGFAPYGQDVMIPHAQDWFQGERGLILTLIDVWVLPARDMTRQDCACWTPVDHYPLPPRVAEALLVSQAHAIAMSRFGERALREIGIDPLYAPHGIDTTLYQPHDHEAAKEQFGFSKDQFIIGMVAANIGRNPPRKGWSQAFQAFADFASTHADAVLAVHTEPMGHANGVNLPQIAQACGIGESQIRFCDQYRARLGYPLDYMTALYSACDVLLNPALGEGFGIPIVEAQACGTPVIVTDWTAMPELCGAGWLVGGDRYWTDQESWWKIPRVESIFSRLEDAYDGAAGLREKAREFSLQYDSDRVFEEHWKPILARIEGEVKPLVEPQELIAA